MRARVHCGGGLVWLPVLAILRFGCGCGLFLMVVVWWRWLVLERGGEQLVGGKNVSNTASAGAVLARFQKILT
jgi:hypothetical protein